MCTYACTYVCMYERVVSWDGLFNDITCANSSCSRGPVTTRLHIFAVGILFLFVY